MASEPTTPKGRRTRDQLVNAGRAVFARDGYVDARMGDVAEEAGVSMGGLYRYFGNKEDLFAQVIHDLHECLYSESTSGKFSFKRNPCEALFESNLGYLRIYQENRDVMRAFIQAAHVESRFQGIWWDMRARHVARFVAALSRAHGITELHGVPVELHAESMACMTEQSAYIWFAQQELRGQAVPLEDAARAVTRSWCATFFPDQAIAAPGVG